MPTDSLRRADLTGKRFGFLTVESFDRKDSSRKTFWLCRCDCGTMTAARSDQLLSERTRSCGCLQRETASKLSKKWITHGMRQSVEYNTWMHIIQRCHNPKTKKFQYWGGRGIKVCDRWRHSFANFYADMGSRPLDKQTIDRIDNDRDYEPGNCRWATWSEQRRNQRRMKH